MAMMPETEVPRTKGTGTHARHGHGQHGHGQEVGADGSGSRRPRCGPARQPCARETAVQCLTQAFPIAGFRAPRSVFRYRCRSRTPCSRTETRDPRTPHSRSHPARTDSRRGHRASHRECAHRHQRCRRIGNPHASGVVQVNADRLCARQFHRGRGRFADLLRAGIADGVGDGDEIDAGLQAVFSTSFNTSFGSTAPVIEHPSAIENRGIDQRPVRAGVAQFAHPPDVGDGGIRGCGWRWPGCVLRWRRPP